MSKQGFSPQISAVCKMTDILLSVCTEFFINTSLTVKENWVHKFVNHHEQLQSKYTQKYNYQQILCENLKIMSDWFQLVKNTQAKYDILNEDIYNFDKTEFQMRIINTVKVMTESQRAEKALVTQLRNWEWVTVIKAINISDWVLFSMIIFADKMHQIMWYKTISLQWTIAVNENKWIINKIDLIWLKTVFNEHTKVCTVEQYWLLILNDHKSHMISEFNWFCLNNTIIILCMSLHLSHLLQSLNVSCFSLLKHTYEHKVKICMQLEHNYIDKLDFLKAFKSVCAAALSSSNIYSRFAAAELVSYDSEWVLLCLQLKLWMFTSSVLKMVIAVCQTLKTLYTVAQLAQKYIMIKKLLKWHLKSLSSSMNQTLKW